MAITSHLQRQFLECAASLFNEELVDEQFAKVMNAKQVKSDFPNTILSVFRRDSGLHINSISEALAFPAVDFRRVYETAQTLNGCSVTIGAMKIRNICSRFEQLCTDRNVAELRNCVQQLQNERTVLIYKLDKLLRLENQIQTAGGDVPVIKVKLTLCRQ